MVAKKRAKKPSRAAKGTHGGVRKGAGGKRQPRTDFTALLAYPSDPLDRQVWTGDVAAALIVDALTDVNISRAQMRSDVRTSIRTLNSTTSKARLRKAEKLIRDEQKQIAAKVHVPMEPAPGTKPDEEKKKP